MNSKTKLCNNYNHLTSYIERYVSKPRTQRMKSRTLCTIGLFCAIVLQTFSFTSGFNVNVKNVKLYRGPERASYFGYSVAMMRSNGQNW